MSLMRELRLNLLCDEPCDIIISLRNYIYFNKLTINECKNEYENGFIIEYTIINDKDEIYAKTFGEMFYLRDSKYFEIRELFPNHVYNEIQIIIAFLIKDLWKIKTIEHLIIVEEDEFSN